MLIRTMLGLFVIKTIDVDVTDRPTTIKSYRRPRGVELETYQDDRLGGFVHIYQSSFCCSASASAAASVTAADHDHV